MNFTPTQQKQISEYLIDLELSSGIYRNQEQINFVIDYFERMTPRELYAILNEQERRNFVLNQPLNHQSNRLLRGAL